MISVLGFDATPNLTIGTVFNRSQFFNAAADTETQNLIKENGMTSMLLYAVYRRAPRVVEALVLLKADVNAADNHGVTPLMLATYQNREHPAGPVMVRSILKHAARSVAFWFGALNA